MQFPSDPTSPSSNPLQPGLFRPTEGSGPFPAVLILHTCAGIRPHLRDWAQRLVDDGYVALIIDSLTPRGVTDNCQGAVGPVTFDQVENDADAAFAHLRKLPYVRGDRLGVMGFSYGAAVAIRLASHHPEGLRAAASFYPPCTTGSRSDSDQAAYRWGNSFVPTILFLGESDTEAAPAGCIGKVDALKAAGQPISYKLYPNTTHGFDITQVGTQGRVITHSGTGRSFLYRYNPDATEDAWREVKAMFDRYLKE